jgi:hypothetical protein
MAQTLLTISDFTSLLEIGFGVNVAASYLSVFVSPLLDRASREIDKFRWLLDNPEKAAKALLNGTTVADLEDRFVEWERLLNKLERTTERVRQKPTGFCIAAALSCFVLLFFPSLHVDILGAVGIGFLAIGPSLLGALFVWRVTDKDRVGERKAADRTKSLIG